MPIIPTATDVRDRAEELDMIEPRERAAAYLRGLLSVVERKNCWQLIESADDENPYGVLHLLGRADWEADRVHRRPRRDGRRRLMRR